MNGSARSKMVRHTGVPSVGNCGMMKPSVTVYSSANVPNVATVFSKMYSGRILRLLSKRRADKGTTGRPTCLSAGTRVHIPMWG